MSQTHSPYTERFYAEQREGSLASARVVLEEAFALLGRPDSLVDVGCGVGTWLHAAADLGVQEFLGLDGAWAPNAGLEIPPEHFHAADLSQGPALIEALPRRRFDLAMSLEVAEHLAAEAAERFVALLVSLSDAVLFSAAIPAQGGLDHVNEAWPGHWAAMFKAQGFQCYDVLRPRVWLREGIEWWYAQNVLLFAKEGSAPAQKLAGIAAPADPPLPLVHPRKFFLHVGRHVQDRHGPAEGELRTLQAQLDVLRARLAAGATGRDPATAAMEVAARADRHRQEVADMAWQIGERDRRINELEQELAQAREQAEADAARAEAAERECARLHNSLSTAQAVARYRAQEAATLRASNSWRATAPLRLAARLLRKRD